MAIKVDVPVRSYKQIRKHADEFLAKYHPAATVPVPVEEIAEFSLGLNIIPIPGLQQALEVDGFISSDFGSITVDQFVMERRECRYRFTLAHEIGHLWLHRDIFAKLQFDSIDGWKTFQKEVNAEDYSWLEWQAYAFAGLVLAPSSLLGDALRDCEREVESEGLKLGTDAAEWYLCEKLGRVFNVSKSVIEKRLAKDRER